MNGLAGGAIATSLIVMLVALRCLQRRFAMGPEVSRKLFHISGGLVSLALPWIFTSVKAVAVLTGLITAILLSVRVIPRLRGSIGLVLSSVNRLSLGELCFPVSVLILFALSHNRRVYYTIPLLILTFADSVAALIGTSYGHLKYAATDGAKSIEGSAAFFLLGFLSVHVPLLLGTDIGRLESILVALILALLLVILEAVCWAGLDNLFVPLCAYVVLHNVVALQATQMFIRLVIMLASIGAILIWGRRTTLNLSGLLGGFLLCYATWIMADWRWVLMPVILFVAHPFLSPVPEWDRYRIHDVHVMVGIFAAGLIWLLAGYFSHRDFLYPFALAFAAHLSIIGSVRRRLSSGGDSKQLFSSASACVILFGAYLLVEGPSRSHLVQCLLAFPSVYAATLLHGKIAGVENRWQWEAFAAGLASLPGLLW